ncbi:MAG: type I DNA topoisomerase [Weeping tea tree witches'-broom phytoplasma]|uniref:type I DNA topoisomerase n=1 Tax=Candidatus Phytoplasma melaleucae TaxID=2982630 RepID=UPI00293B23ED|nr:type I DNA topoisomerase [Weeping tea tree witches'-broom phytoplasma]
MKLQVIIVESPSKAKTISHYFNNQVSVLFSKGHIRNLSLQGEDRLGINIHKDFAPDYCIIPRQKKIVEDLIRKTRGKNVFLATDPDREGEAIAWHLAQILNLKKTDRNRIFFTEVTRDVVLQAFQNPVTINEFLVHSQETRMILDKIIGFKLSHLVQRIKSKSAGRVQSVALKLIAEREEERKNFVTEEYHLIKAIFQQFQANLVVKPTNYKMKEIESKKIINEIKNKSFWLKEVKQTQITKTPPRPFITATLQQEAFKNISMSAKQTMIAAQKLYEGVAINGKITGLITYMRTDSFRMSTTFITQAQQWIQHRYGKKYLQDYKPHRQQQIQNAHEAIRVTDCQNTPQSLTAYLNKYEMSLYNMIYQRTLASLMSPAFIHKTKLIFQVEKYLFTTEGYRVVFDGYYKLLEYDPFKEILLPALKIHQDYSPQSVISYKKFTTPPAYFNEASLVKTLENLKIGRPSTYSSIIETLKKRYYIQIKDKKMICTEQGIVTKKILDNFFASFVNFEYTAKMEAQLDAIAGGHLDKLSVLRNFYHDFMKLFMVADKQIKIVKPILTDQRCSLCDAFLVERKGKYGSFLGCSAFPKCKNIVSLQSQNDLKDKK